VYIGIFVDSKISYCFWSIFQPNHMLFYLTELSLLDFDNLMKYFIFIFGQYVLHMSGSFSINNIIAVAPMRYRYFMKNNL
jgi:hypothetical protein